MCPGPGAVHNHEHGHVDILHAPPRLGHGSTAQDRRDTRVVPLAAQTLAVLQTWPRSQRAKAAVWATPGSRPGWWSHSRTVRAGTVVAAGSDGMPDLLIRSLFHAR